MTDGPLIVQSDKTLLLEVDHEQAGAARAAIAPFAELERSPEHVHTYRLTPLGLWNARAAGHDAEQVIDALVRYSRYAVPHALLVDVADTMDRYGRLQITKDPAHGLVLVSLDRAVLEEVLAAEPDEAFALQPDGVVLCGACRRLGRCHLGLTEEVLGDDGVVRTELECPPSYEGGPNVAHGGWTALAFLRGSPKARLGLGDIAVLQLGDGIEVMQRRLLRGHGRLGLFQGRPVVAIVDLDQ